MHPESFHASGEVGCLVSVEGEERRHVGAATPGGADTQDRLVLWYLLEAIEDLSLADENGVGEGAERPLVRLTHVEHGGVVLVDPRLPVGGDDLGDVAHEAMLEGDRPQVARLVLHSAALEVRRPDIDIAVLASGSGTNLQALIDTPAVRPKIALVLSDKPGAHALTRAGDAGIQSAVVRWSDHPDREAFSNALADLVENSGSKGVVLAGFMRILSPSFVDRFPNRILNIHPALLPSFPGAHPVEEALEYGVTTTGVTVHFVDEQVDHGPIVTQVPVDVLPDDTAETLHARIQVEEHRVYPRVVRAFVEGRLSVEGRRVRWR